MLKNKNDERGNVFVKNLSVKELTWKAAFST